MEETVGGQTISERIARQIIGHLPLLYILLPPPKGAVNDPSLWRIVPVGSEDAESRLRGETDYIRAELMLTLMHIIVDPEDRERSLVQMKEGEIIGFNEFIHDLTESIIDSMPAAYGRGEVMTQTSCLRIMRMIGDVISGAGPDNGQASRPSDTWEKERTLRKMLRDKHAVLQSFFLRFFSLPRPILLLVTQTKEAMAVRLPQGFVASSQSLADELRTIIGRKYAERVSYVANPLHQAICSIYEESLIQTGRLFRDCAELDDARDRAFLERIRRDKILAGSGKYVKFSLKHYYEKNIEVIQCACSMMGERFLQQVTSEPEPAFVYWDTARYPITISVQGYVSSRNSVALSRLNEVGLGVECAHPSICRHAFVKALDNDKPTEGVICTEETRSRIIALHRRCPGFDHIVCFLEQMRAASRILKYGVRERDAGIQQHNPFRGVPEYHYQAVVRGWDRAKRFAKERNAEIIAYKR